MKLKPSIYWLFIFIPISVFLNYSDVSAPLIFFSAALSIIPVAKLIGTSTEHLASYTGDAAGGLLNATFGNAPELIIAVVALNAGLHDLVLASIAGAILANILLAMGFSFLVGGIKYHDQDYNPASIRVYSSMMLIAVICLMVPGAFKMMSDESMIRQEHILNILVASILLIGYVLYLVFMLKTHSEKFVGEVEHSDNNEENHWSKNRAIITLASASILAAFMSEILVGAAEATGEVLGMSSVFIGVIFLSIVGGAAESISAINMASKNKMDLSIGIAMGSSIQIALFVAPVLVLLSLFVGPELLHLVFERRLLIILLLVVVLGTVIAGDGKSNWYKGVQLIMVYLIISILFYLMPEST